MKTKLLRIDSISVSDKKVINFVNRSDNINFVILRNGHKNMEAN